MKSLIILFTDAIAANHLNRALAVLCCIAFSSCGVYRQNVVNVPLLERKGDARLGGYVSFNGFEGQAAYALTNKVALIANYCNTGYPSHSYSTYNYEVNHHDFGEAGVGFYKKTKKEKTAELLVLAGFGTTSRYVTAGLTSITSVDWSIARYSRLTVQGDWGYGQNKFYTGFSPRICVVGYYGIEDTAHDIPYTTSTHLYLEGALTMRYKVFNFLAISGQLCMTIPAIREDTKLDFSPFNTSIGLVADMNFLKRKKTALPVEHEEE